MSVVAVPAPVVSAAELDDFLGEAFPHAPRSYRVTDVTEGGVRLRLPVGPEQSRPGGTVSGPAMMALADGAAWLATLSRIGIVPLAVTSNLTISFLAKPPLSDLVAEADLLRLAPRSSVCTVRISSDGGPLVAHATVAYAIPAER